MKDILYYIKEEIDKTNSISIDKTDVDYVNKFDINLFKLAYYDKIEILILFYMVKTSKSYNDSKDKIYECLDFYKSFLECEPHAIIDFCEILYQVKDSLNLDENIDIDEYNKLKLKNQDYKDLKKLIKDFMNIFDKKSLNIILKQLMDDDLRDSVAFIGNICEIKDELEEYEGDNLERIIDEKYEEYDDLTRNDASKIVNEAVMKVRSFLFNNANKILKEQIDSLIANKNHLNKQYEKKLKEKNYSLRDLNLLVDDIKKGKLSIDVIKKYKISDELYNRVLFYLIDLKNKEYLEVYETLNELKKNDISNLELLFHKYGYNFNLIDYVNQNLLANRDLLLIEDNINYIKNSSLSFIEEGDKSFVRLLLLKKDVLENLNSLYNRKRITKEFLLNSILLDSINIRKTLDIIDKLELLKLDFEKLNKYNPLLITNINRDLLDLLIKYNIGFNTENFTNFELFQNNKLIDLVDMYIENGLINQLIAMPNIINSNGVNIIKRINIMRLIDEPYINKHGTLVQSVYNGKDFYLGDEYLDNYNSLNCDVYMNNDMKELLDNSDNLKIIDVIPDEINFIEEYRDSNLTYKIGDMIFSRNKVLRLLNTLIENNFNNYSEMLFNVLIYNYPNNLSIDNINELKDIIGRNNIKKYI